MSSLGHAWFDVCFDLDDEITMPTAGNITSDVVASSAPVAVAAPEATRIVSAAHVRAYPRVAAVPNIATVRPPVPVAFPKPVALQPHAPATARVAFPTPVAQRRTSPGDDAGPSASCPHVAVKSPPPASARPPLTVHHSEVCAADRGEVCVPAGSRDRSPRRPSQRQVDNENWIRYEVRLNKNYAWYETPPGIFDLRINFPVHDRASEGTRLQQAIRACNYILGKAEAYFKVGMATNLGTRWEMYRDCEDPHKFKPSHLFLVMDIVGREAAGMAESALISMLRDKPVCHNVNFLNKDKGGTGPRFPGPIVHYLYLALKVAPRSWPCCN